MKKSNLLNADAEKRINNMPTIMRCIVLTLIDCIDNIMNGECDEDAIISAMSTLNNNSKGRFCKSDLMNYDQAGEELGFGKTNRVGLKKLLNRNGIKEVCIGKIKVGFRRDEIMVLKERMQYNNSKNHGTGNRK